MKAKHVTTTVIVLFFFVSLFITTSFAQDIEDLQKGVVKIETTTFQGKHQVGTGFIVHLEQDAVYIVTAAHVVEGASEIEVEFFTRRNRQILAEVIGMEGGDPQGLATLMVEENIPSGLSILSLTSSIRLRGGESVTTIGFPRISGVPWAVIRGDIVGRKGKTVTFSGAVDEGNSGGPLLKDGQVIGVVTQVTDQFAYAIPTIILQYVLEGWGIRIEDTWPPPTATPTPLSTATPIPLSTVTPTPLPTATPAMIRLRSEPRTVSVDEAQTVFGLDKNWRPLEYIENDFEDRGDVVVDRATSLMWQQSGSEERMTYEQAQVYIEKLNWERFGGYDDWRLPMVPELMSLLEPKEQSNDLYINPIFDEEQYWCWSADMRIKGEGSSGSAWLVLFYRGGVGWHGLSGNFYVRGVRS